MIKVIPVDVQQSKGRKSNIILLFMSQLQYNAQA